MHCMTSTTPLRVCSLQVSRLHLQAAALAPAEAVPPGIRRLRARFSALELEAVGHPHHPRIASCRFVLPRPSIRRSCAHTDPTSTSSMSGCRARVGDPPAVHEEKIGASGRRSCGAREGPGGERNKVAKSWRKTSRFYPLQL